MRNVMRLLAVAVVATGVSVQGQALGGPVQVGLELSLLVDVSGSVDATEFALQRNGYVQAFQNGAIQTAIANTPGGIAVNYIYWSGAGQQQHTVGWTHLTDAASANAFAAAIAAAGRPFSGNTAPGSAINFAVPLFTSNDDLFISDRQVIDVSGDGAQNEGANTATARNNALAAGIDTINGLPILGEPGLLVWYQNNIQGGTNSFTLPAGNFADFQSAVGEKLEREIVNSVPEPASLALLAVGACGLVGYARRRKANSAFSQQAA